METETKPSISYTGAVLLDLSRARLLEAVAGLVPAGWTLYAHHMTLNMGPFNQSLNPGVAVGHLVMMTVTHAGFDDRVVAVRVESDVASANKVPHITVAVNRDGGGKPKHSNDLPETAWVPLDTKIELCGWVTEVENPKEPAK